MTPLDKYDFTVFVFAIEKATNKSVPIATFAVGDAGPGDCITTSKTVPSTNMFAYDTEGGPVTAEVESYITHVQVKHSTRARALTPSMFAINWVLTLCSLVITMIAANRREVREVLPFSRLQPYWPSQPLGVFTWAHRHLEYFSVRTGAAPLRSKY